VKRYLWALLALSTACSTKLEPVDPGAFACDGDSAASDGLLPCPESHWCKDGACTPRLDCNIPNASSPGCDPERRCELFNEVQSCFRCELRTNAEVAAVTCAPGVQTETSTHPLSLDPCSCSDDLTCVAFLSDGRDGEAYPLLIIPEGGSLPVGRTEIEEWRMCTRVCSHELDCPAAHTCRAASAGSTGRSTIGVCYPDLLTRTSSSSTTAPPLDQPDTEGCAQHNDCRNSSFEPCRYRTVQVPDHPVVPAGPSSWGQRFAIISRCSSGSTGMRNAGDGCTDDGECKSGLCAEGRCARPCQPGNPDACGSNIACVDIPVVRDLPGSAVIVEDRAQICASF
jgi:hypothetical protein